MRKTSQDGGDTSSITSGVENEIKKSGGILKTKRNSIKRKVQGLSHESDDAVIEPLLQKDKEKSEVSNQSAKFDLLSKTKTEAASAKRDDKEKLIQDYKTQNSLSDAQNFADTGIAQPSTSQLPKSTGATAPLHNHMNTNVFSSHEALKGLVTTKSQMLVEIDGSKQAGYNPSPVIFTTAKIHTDGKNKHNMEPLHVTPVPILSTIEVSLLKGAGSSNSSDISGLVTSNISPTSASTSKSNTYSQDKDQKPKSTTPAVTTLPSKTVDTKALNTSEKQSISIVTPATIKRSIESVSNKDINSDKSPAGQLKDIKSINIELKKDKEGRDTKLSLSQPVSTLSSEEAKTAVASGKPVIVTNSSTVSQVQKDGASGTFGAMKMSGVDDPKEIEQKTDLNKNIKSNVSREITSQEVFDNKTGALTKDKTALNAMSTSTKQLQRQKIAIDKDDPNTKSKSNIASFSLSNESKPIKKPDDSTTSMPKAKSTANDVSRVNEKSKLPVSTTNNVQSTSHIAAFSNKPATNTVDTIINKTTTSNSVTSAKPIVTSHSTTLQQPKTPVTKITDAVTKTATSTVLTSSIPKSLPNNSKMTDSEAKYTDNSSTKVQSARTVSSKLSTSIAPGNKMPNTSTIETPSTTSLTIANNNSTTVGSRDAVVKLVPSETNKTTDSNAKSSSIATYTTKSPSATTSATKTLSKSANMAKSPPATTSAAKNISTSTSNMKNPALSTSTVKSTPISTNSIKTPPVTSSASKSTTTKGSITPSSKANLASPAVSNPKVDVVSTITTTATTGTTSNSTVSNKKTEAKSTELSNGNKSFKA